VGITAPLIWALEKKGFIVSGQNKKPSCIRAYSDFPNHVLIRMGNTEYGMDLICAMRLLRDLKFAVDTAIGWDTPETVSNHPIQTDEKQRCPVCNVSEGENHLKICSVGNGIFRR